MTKGIIVAVMLLLSACAPGEDFGAVAPGLNAALIDEGAPVYDAYCAECHGIDGSGQENWKAVKPDGTYPAPPHDSTGHTWHHADQLLIDIITNGGGFPSSQMPAFGDRLSPSEVRSVLEYIKAWWGPDERAYQADLSERAE